MSAVCGPMSYLDGGARRGAAIKSTTPAAGSASDHKTMLGQGLRKFFYVLLRNSA